MNDESPIKSLIAAPQSHLWLVGLWRWWRGRPVDKAVLVVVATLIGLWLLKHAQFEVRFFFRELERIKDFAHSGDSHDHIAASRYLTNIVGAMLGAGLVFLGLIANAIVYVRRHRRP